MNFPYHTQEGFQKLVTEYSHQLSVFLFRMGFQEEKDREDILQNAFLTAWKYIYSYKPAFSMKSWIYRITRQQAILYRKKHFRNHTPFAQMEESRVENFLAAIDIEEEQRSKDLEPILSNALTRLKDDQKTALILRYEENLDYKDIGDIMQKPIGTISTLIKRGKEQLKQQILSTYSLHDL